MGFATVIYFIGIGSGVAFLIGLALHGFIAVRLQLPCKWAWWYCLAISVISMMVIRPTGTIVGAVLVLSLIGLPPFRILRRGVEQ